MQSIIHKFRSQDKRSRKMYLNILLSFFAKGWSGVVQLAIVPLTLLCLSSYEYGIWLTISSILLWIDSFDIGLGNGLRNKLAEFVANDDWEKAQQAVSTTFFMLVTIITPLAVVIIILLPMFDLYSLLNVDVAKIPNLTGILQLCVASVCATFVFKIVGNVYLGLQMPAINNILVVAGQTLSLVGIAVISTLHVENSFLWVSVAYTFCPLVVYILTCPITFHWKYPRLRPRISSWRQSMLKDLFALGLSFFALQIFGIILFTTSNLIITRCLGPEDVTPYQIAYRYYSFALMLFSIIISPLWSATTDAYAKNDMEWIAKSCRRALQMLAAMVALVFVMTLASGILYPIWTLGKVDIPFSLTLLMAVYVFILMFSLLYAQFLYGFGKIRIQSIITGLEAVAFVPLALCGIRHLGVQGIVLALILVNLACAVTNYIQFNKIIRGTARGIWMK